MNNKQINTALEDVKIVRLHGLHDVANRMEATIMFAASRDSESKAQALKLDIACEALEKIGHRVPRGGEFRSAAIAVEALAKINAET